ncbi:HFX_2341 family transcriptional regulator domain-containing protein [Candidatus Lokiarchaeum ossiferum]|uniref:HFX_2341 family transcriptional regulator domain-containing protein n=1 Tax=Candidatus Lokiarchaeum ossiferum TaxID=2951803 RepID=UPI00352F2F4F
MIYQERVHIIPVGDDDVDRIVIPAIQGKADKVYLVTMDDKDLFQTIVQEAESRLRDLRIEVIVKRCNLESFSDFILEIARIIKSEIDKKNILNYSISTGGNLAAAAGMLACLLFQIRPYFIKKDFSIGKISKEQLNIPLYHMDVPGKPLILFLNDMKTEMDNHGTTSISKKDCLELMKRRHPDEIFSSTSGEYNKLKFRYLDKLLGNHFIDIESKVRGRISITSEGLFAWDFFTIYYNVSSRN